MSIQKDPTVHEHAKCVYMTVPQNLSSLNFRDDRIDWNKIKSELNSVGWTKEFGALNITETITKSLNISYRITKRYVPLKARYRSACQIDKKLPRERKKPAQKT